MLITRSLPTVEANSLASLKRVSQLDNVPLNTLYFILISSSGLSQSAWVGNQPTPQILLISLSCQYPRRIARAREPLRPARKSGTLRYCHYTPYQRRVQDSFLRDCRIDVVAARWGRGSWEWAGFSVDLRRRHVRFDGKSRGCVLPAPQRQPGKKGDIPWQ